MSKLNQNFKTVVDQLLKKGYKLTEIAKLIGYTTTTQIHNVMEGKSIITSPPLEKFVEKFNVNPNFLFSGNGKMFNISHKNNIGFVVYNSEIDAYLGINDCFMSNIKSAMIYYDKIYAESIKFNYPIQYPNNPYNKHLDVKTVCVEEI